MLSAEGIRDFRHINGDNCVAKRDFSVYLEKKRG